MARLPDLENFAKQHKIKIGTIADIIEFRSKKEKLIKKIDQKTIETDYGKLNLLLYSDLLSNNVHLALVKGKILKNDNVLVRVHEPLSILDFIKNTKHSWPPLKALELLGNEKKGVIVFLNYSESHKKLENIFSPNEKYNTKQDLRNYGIGSQILVDLGVSKMRLMASPRKMPSMIGFGLQVTEFIENN
jgi:3,4-dihydroxy 2-butanone 4-phosphate synthase/GTP cyclohydrolase II